MKENSIVWNWEPLISVGIVQFGEPATPVIEKYKLRREPEFDTPDWEAYQVPNGETLISVENSCLASVSCYDNLFYRGKNLLELALEEIRKILGQEDEIGEMVGEKIPVEYESLGLQLWFRDDVVVDATCYGFIEDD